MSKYIFLFCIVAAACSLVLMVGCKGGIYGNIYTTAVITDRNMEGTINVGDTVHYQKGNVTRGDIVAFYIPHSFKISCLRAIGFPGDKIEIVKGIILINGKEYNLANTAKTIYVVYSKRPNDFLRLKEYGFKPYSSNYGLVCVTLHEKKEIVRNGLVDSIYQAGFDSSYVYPEGIKARSFTHFNHYYFGPVFIPRKGDTVFEEDKMLINRFSDFRSAYFVTDEAYYFCIGDCFSDAMDSRVIGLIPQSSILGKVDVIKNSKIAQVNSY